MKNTNDKASGNLDIRNENTQPARSHKWIRVAAITVGSLMLTAIVLIAGITLYLSPDRLKNIISEEGSRYLAADVKVASANYTFWSTFPNFRIVIDSLSIESRTLGTLTPDDMATLPKGCRQLLTVDRLTGAIDIWKVLRKEISLKDISITRPACNLVAINDSVNNFNIFPKLPEGMKVPHISINTIDVVAPVRVSYLDAAAGMRCDATIDRASLRLVEGKTDRYSLDLTGEMAFKGNEVSTVNPVPVRAGGEIAMGFSPLTVTVSNFKTAVTNINATAALSLIGGSSPVISKMNLDISCDDLMTAASHFSFPEGNIINSIEGVLPLSANIHLDSPYRIASATPLDRIPAFSMALDLSGAEVAYPVKSNQKLELYDVMLRTDLHIDPANAESSVLLVPAAKASADGTSMQLSASVTELLTADPMLTADIKCIADLAKTYGKITGDSNLKIEGTLNGASAVKCRLSDINDKKLKDLNFKGNFNVSSLKVNDVVSRLAADIKDLSLKIKACAPSLSPAGIGDSRVRLLAKSSSGCIISNTDSATVSFSALGISGKLGAKGTMANPTLGGLLDVNAGNIRTATKRMSFDANGVEMDISADMRHVPWVSASSYSVTPSSTDDSILSRRVNHTPQYLVVSAPPLMQTVMSLLDMKANVRINNGMLLSDAYPARNGFSDLDLATNLDTLTIKNINLSTRGAEATLSGNVAGLRNFLMSSSPTPLTVDMDAHFNDVDINRLSGNYYLGQERLSGKPTDYNVPRPGAYTAADSLCVLIPRNLYADLRLRADRAEYMQWQFSPLSTDITLHDGVAKIGKLSVGAEYGSVAVDWTYSTADLNDIFMQLDADIDNFNVGRFFKAFPMVTASAPELLNLSGSLSAQASGKLLMFPDMFVNAPSMTADVNLHSSGVEFRREGKIKRITNLMFIRGDAPLKINDLDIHGFFHDNLLQVDPFTIACGPYRLGVAGANNLQGEMYYHMGLHGSPFRIPFGVNFVGNWRHPSIRFGGAAIHDGRERQISSNLADDVNVNIMRELKHGWLLFVESAARYDSERNPQTLNADNSEFEADNN